jgi:glycosyltransferase involved in cell wall biosynthesis
VESRKIKIARIIARLNIGGPAIHAVLLTQGLNDTNTQSFLIAGQVSPGEADMLCFAERHGVSPIIVPHLGREISWWNDLAALWKLYRILLRERPDVVHTHTAKAGALGRLAGMLARIPVLVHTYHGHVFRGYFGRLKTALFVLTERLLALWTDRIIAISQQQCNELCSIYRIAPREKFSVIPLGFDLDPFLRCNQSAKEGMFETRDVVIGVIGRMVPIKNHRMAIDVCAHVVREEMSPCPVRMIMVGDGPLRRDMEQYARQAGLEQCIMFQGWQSNLAKIYEEIDLALLTSINEGTPVALIEAMAAGLPFVATRVGGIPDLMVGKGRAMCGSAGRGAFTVYDNGILVESGDVAGCATAVVYLAGDRATSRRMGEEGRRFVCNRHTRGRLLQDMQVLYSSLLEQKALL